MGKRIDLTGQIFGDWTVLRYDIEGSKGSSCAKWICRCSCGTIKSVGSQSLREGKSKSCGCKKIKNLVGSTFGYLEVLKLDESKKERTTYWICLCHGCGREISVESRALQYHLKSCGCKRYDIISEKQSAHLEGQTFGKLTVLERDFTKPKGHDAYWICKCECGNKTVVRSCDLVKGKTKSCGCLISAGEFTLNQILSSLDINYITQYKFPDLIGDYLPLKFDFFLPDYNTLIEYQGGQHYKPVNLFGGEEKFQQQQRYDNLKREYCKEHGYRLIEISYLDYEKLSEDYILKLLKEDTNA